jgi:hypothetical protein
LGNSHFFISSGFSEDFGVQLMRARSFSVGRAVKNGGIRKMTTTRASKITTEWRTRLASSLKENNMGGKKSAALQQAQRQGPQAPLLSLAVANDENNAGAADVGHERHQSTWKK